MKSNINALLDKCEDPAKMIDQTLRDLREDLAEVKFRGAGEVFLGSFRRGDDDSGGRELAVLGRERLDVQQAGPGRVADGQGVAALQPAVGGNGRGGGA